MPADEHYIEASNLSVAWGKALRLVSRRGLKEVVPLIVSVTGFDQFGRAHEHAGIREALDGVLKSAGKYSCETVANTIFPESLWNPDQPRARLFERYDRIGMPSALARFSRCLQTLAGKRTERGTVGPVSVPFLGLPRPTWMEIPSAAIRRA